MRAPMTGSADPEYCNLIDMPYHTYVTGWHWDGCGLPFQDVDGIDTVADMVDRDNEELVPDLLADRVERGDAAPSMAASALMANAYLLTGEARYREWVREYVDAWRPPTTERNRVFCAAMNSPAGDAARPDTPLNFTKYYRPLVGQQGPITCHDHATGSPDFEGELAVVIGRGSISRPGTPWITWAGTRSSTTRPPATIGGCPSATGSILTGFPRRGWRRRRRSGHGSSPRTPSTRATCRSNRR